jgi:iron complex outermembrane receptor protein
VNPNVSLNGSISYIKLLKFSNTDPTQAALLLNVPDLKLKASVAFQNLFVDRSFLRIFGRYQDAYEFRAGRWNSTVLLQDGKVAARFVADIAAGYSFDNGLAVSGNVNNLFNDHGVDQLGSPQSGRMAYVQLTYKYSGFNN